MPQIIKQSISEELQEMQDSSNGVIKRIGNGDVNDYEQVNIGPFRYDRVPKSEDGGGVKGNPYGFVGKTVKHEFDPDTETFQATGEVHIPDSVRYKNNSPEFLQKLADMRKGNKKTTKVTNMAKDFNLEQALIEKGFDPETVTAFLNQNQVIVENTVEEDTSEVVEENSVELPVQRMFSEASEEEVSNASSPDNTDLFPSKMNVETDKTQVQFETKAGTFRTYYYSITELPELVVCIFDSEQDLFTPIVAKTAEDSFILHYNSKAVELFHVGNEMQIPGTNLSQIIFIKKG